MRNANNALVRKGEDENVDSIVTKALADLQKAVDDRLKAVETKTAANDNTKLVDRLAAVETKLNRPTIIKGDNDNEPTEERKAFVSYLRRGKESMPADETKSLRIADDTSGGIFATAEFTTEVIKNVVERSPIRQAARVGSTANGSVLLPKRTGTPTGYWVGETETRTATESTYGQLEIPIHEMACYVDVSVRLLEDAAINVESEVAFDLGEEFGRLESQAFMTGNGTKKPLGIMETAGVGYTFTGNASTLGTTPTDVLTDALYSLTAFYRNRSTWLMNGTTLAAMRKLKDGEGRALWAPPLVAGQPEMLLGRPVIEDPEMEDIGSAAEPIVIGDFETAYRIYDRVALSIMRDPYTQATNGLVRFHARRRVGGGMTMAAALRKIRCATS